jgi:hypothetical protein
LELVSILKFVITSERFFLPSYTSENDFPLRLICQNFLNILTSVNISLFLEDSSLHLIFLQGIVGS